MGKVGIIAALEREIRPLIRAEGWRVTQAVRAAYHCYEGEQAVVVCAGIGGTHARKAAEDLLAASHPALLVSAGLAGALVPELRVGRAIVATAVIDGESGAVVRPTWKPEPEIPGISYGGILVSASGIAGPEGKRRLAEQHLAQLVDMEAAPVAEVASRHGVPFVAVKVISDELGFPVPDLGPFVDEQGRFRTGKFLLHTAVRPGEWSVVRRLAANTTEASQELCRALRLLLDRFVQRVETRNRVFVSSAGVEHR